MRRSLLVALLVGATALVALPVLGAQGANSHASSRAVCPNPPAGYAHCHVLVVTDSHGNPLASSSPTGLSPATIKNVYGFQTGSTTGAGETIAIVDAYDDPNAASDLATFSSKYKLPSASFTKVDQNGGTNYPRASSSWALEISLDIEWAHAIAPGAKILLVEARSSSFKNLLAAEDWAANNATYVSNSWGGSESSGETSYDSHFSKSGVSFFASAGDSGLPAEYPSASPNVISVGGTTLTQVSSTSWSETGWSSGGGGCSAYEKATSAQKSYSTYGQAGCNGARATPDVSLDADPRSGVSVYDSVQYQGQSGWFTVGGTSVSSPIWAAASADTGAVVNSSYVYGNNITFNDVTAGNNGAPCLIGYDLCTGLGSWMGSGSELVPSGGGSTQSPDFTISASPSSQTVKPSGSTSYTVSTSSLNSDGSSVSLQVSGLPSGASASFSPSSVTAGSSSVLTVTTSNTPTSSYSLAIKGTDGYGNTHTVNVTLVVGSSSTQSMNVTLSATVSTKGHNNYQVPLTVTATDSSSGGGIAGASVLLDIYQNSICSGSPAASGSATTGTNGQASFTFHTKTATSWCAEATVTASGYSATTRTTTFTTP